MADYRLWFKAFVENIIYFVISTIILFYLNWKLALACFIVMIPIGFIAVQLEKSLVNVMEK